MLKLPFHRKMAHFGWHADALQVGRAVPARRLAGTDAFGSTTTARTECRAYHHRPDTRLGVRGASAARRRFRSERESVPELLSAEAQLAGSTRDLAGAVQKGLARVAGTPEPARQMFAGATRAALREMLFLMAASCRPSGQVLAKNSRNDFETISARSNNNKIDIAELRFKCASRCAPSAPTVRPVQRILNDTLLLSHHLP